MLGLILAGFLIATEGPSQVFGGGGGNNPSSSVPGRSDVSSDVQLGQRTIWGTGTIELPVSVTNTGSETADMTVWVAAESPDGSIQYDTSVVTFYGVAPGQTARDTALFSNSSTPWDAEYVVMKATRWKPL